MTESFFRDDNAAADAAAPERLQQSAEERAARRRGIDEGEFETEEGRLAAVMAYIPILCLVPLLNIRDNKEARFHARQGMLLFLVEVVAVLFLVDGVSSFVFRVILILAVGLAVAGVALALQGRGIRLPLLGDLAEKVKL
ncbi:MAG TPA: hypothetical protein PLR32_06800 [candidate division Zixibacteria bacterium]|nr:hypothetical protein [candidate division Zixibacteria bacterium]MDD4918470.1 hypothetical protein [candidate division Zixibacteria bacterium]MDM7971797.1 hypothetical protein [candidate division Zixibacteria bacterium]HOD65907.1 hypothetical protein [candidate division Zixibacteria bacterium]HOZ09002.1 hypothetical protein [candidate division Zixibacteria bacterium]